MEKTHQTLVIVESPTKAKTITRFLPKGYKVIASKGHIRDLGEKDMAIDVDHGYACKYQIVEGKAPLIKELKDELSKSDHLLLATDEDREGESISWHLVQVLKPKVPYQRMVFHEITKGAILAALEHGRPIDENLVQAQEGRRLVDRLYGYTLSPTLWAKLANKKLSAGRVQSVGLRLAVDREKERIAFEKHSYDDVVANLVSQKGEAYQARLTSIGGKNLVTGKDYDSVTGVFKGKDVLLYDDESIKDVVENLKTRTFVVREIETKPFVTHPPIPFTTSTLQQEGIRKLHMSAALVMSTAQRLYENGFITYMRTDSPTLSKEGTFAARDAVKGMYGDEYLSDAPRFFTAHTAGAQEAHEAIRPAGGTFRSPESTGLGDRELQLYSLIWKRTLACQMADARKSTTTVRIDAGDALFTASGTQVLFPGFIRAYIEGSDEVEKNGKDTVLPPLEKGETERLDSLLAESHQTKARARYSEASLVQELEKRGIGRPSTYATILKTLLDRFYVVKDKGFLVPTFTGFAVCQYLEQHFAKFIDYDFTSRMESDLDLIAEGKEGKLDFLNAFYKGPQGLAEQNKEQMGLDNKVDSRTVRLPQVADENPIMIGPYGCYVQKKNGEGEKPTSLSIPSDWMPGTVTDEMVKDLLAKGKAAFQSSNEEIGDGITLKNGKFGPYWQRDKKSASVPKWASDDQRHDVVFATRYLSLPRILGKDAEGNDVIANLGKYGPYVGAANNYRNLSKTDRNVQLFSITLEEALSLLAQEKKSYRSASGTRSASKGSRNVQALKELGTFENLPVKVCGGKYGFYVKHGNDNYALPTIYKKDEEKAKSLVLEQAIEIINKKRQKDTM